MNEKLMLTVDEEELFDIMCDYTDVEHTVHNLLVVLEVLEDHYREATVKELYAVISLILSQIEIIQKKLREAHDRADRFLLKKQ